ncbi:hypothetical protein [Aliiroseovarius marinus]|uniref:hypothetical protein n=1 Tax=Aliiroseovarius marinus TaxID=2500159 RepID=UPI003D7E7524
MIQLVQNTKDRLAEITSKLPEDIYALIPTTRDLEAIVDAKYYDQLRAIRWFALIRPPAYVYAVADFEGKRISLHQYVLSLASPNKAIEDIKHVTFHNRFSLDCRLENLTTTYDRQSVTRNRRGKRNTSSEFKGVRKAYRTNGAVYWRAEIYDGKGRVSLGNYDDEEWAAKVYDAAAYLIFDGTAYYNFPDCVPNVEAVREAAARLARHKAKKARRDAV